MYNDYYTGFYVNERAYVVKEKDDPSEAMSIQLDEPSTDNDIIDVDDY